ncbi:MAG: Lrp/AsnC family transcriptional regulator [Chloroflexota bacterium]
MAQLTPLDQKILEILFEDGRTPASEIAEQLGEASSTIRNRIRRLEALGVIRGYQAVIDRTKLGFDIKAIIQVEQDTNKSNEEFMAGLRQVDPVVRVVQPIGQIDALVSVWAKNVEDLGKTIAKINALPGVIRTVTAVVLHEESYLPPISSVDEITG